MNEAYRMTVEFSAEKCEKKSLQRLQMRVPGGKNCMDKRRAGSVGQYIEVHGAKNKLLYRRNLGKVIPVTIGIPGGGADKPYAQVPLSKLKMLASILVPAFDETEQIVLMEAVPSGKKSSKGKMPEIVNNTLIKVKIAHGKEAE